MNTGLAIGATAVLLLLNGFFVAAEFALVSARRAGIEPYADAGSRRAVTTLRAMERVSVMLAGAQLGITLCSLALGALSEPAIAHLLRGLFADVGVTGAAVEPVAFVLALVLITVLHVVLGEMVPKNIALAAPERSSLWLSPILAAMIRIARPVIWLLNGTANLTLRALRVKPQDEVTSAFTRDEVADMIEQSHRGGLMPGDERALLGGALAFDRATAADLTLPLERVYTLGVSPTPAQVEALAARTGVTRFPLRDGDNLVGYVHLKDTLVLGSSEHGRALPPSSVRALPTVAAGASLAAAIDAMRTAHAHLAAVVGEAGLLGVITLDDILSSLVGPGAA